MEEKMEKLETMNKWKTLEKMETVFPKKKLKVDRSPRARPHQSADRHEGEEVADLESLKAGNPTAHLCSVRPVDTTIYCI